MIMPHHMALTSSTSVLKLDGKLDDLTHLSDLGKSLCAAQSSHASIPGQPMTVD